MASYRAVTDFYDAEYASLDILADDVPFFLSQIPAEPLEVLEVAVGTGRAAVPIVQAGHRVVGFDIDPAMLAIARRRRDELGWGEDEIELHEADATKLDLGQAYHGRFDVAAIFFNTFLAFTTTRKQSAVLKGVAKHLKPDGLLWIDVFFPDLPFIAAGEQGDLEPLLFQAPDGRHVMRLTSVSPDFARQVQHVRFDYEWLDVDGEAQSVSRQFDMAWIMPRELTLLLEMHGFKVVATFGDHGGGKLRDNSPRLIVAAELRR